MRACVRAARGKRYSGGYGRGGGLRGGRGERERGTLPIQIHFCFIWISPVEVQGMSWTPEGKAHRIKDESDHASLDDTTTCV